MKEKELVIVVREFDKLNLIENDMYSENPDLYENYKLSDLPLVKYTEKLKKENKTLLENFNAISKSLDNDEEFVYYLSVKNDLLYIAGYDTFAEGREKLMDLVKELKLDIELIDYKIPLTRTQKEDLRKLIDDVYEGNVDAFYYEYF